MTGKARYLDVELPALFPPLQSTKPCKGILHSLVDRIYAEGSAGAAESVAVGAAAMGGVVPFARAGSGSSP